MVGVEIDNRPMLRAYSIASANHEDFLRFLSIKVPDGLLTSRLQHMRAGDQIPSPTAFAGDRFQRAIKVCSGELHEPTSIDLEGCAPLKLYILYFDPWRVVQVDDQARIYECGTDLTWGDAAEVGRFERIHPPSSAGRTGSLKS